jgi:hypothetical protein
MTFDEFRYVAAAFTLVGLGAGGFAGFMLGRLVAPWPWRTRPKPQRYDRHGRWR